MTATRSECEECKAYGHSWVPSAPNPYFEKVSDRCLFSDCVRCESSKADDIDLDGVPYSTQYYYSAAYRQFLDTGPERRACRNLVYERTLKPKRKTARRRLESVA